MFLGTLQAVSDVIDRPATDDVAQALETALRYFSQAAPKHTADEEESLFPRPRQVANPEVTTSLSRLTRWKRNIAGQIHFTQMWSSWE